MSSTDNTTSVSFSQMLQLQQQVQQRQQAADNDDGDTPTGDSGNNNEQTPGGVATVSDSLSSAVNSASAAIQEQGGTGDGTVSVVQGDTDSCSVDDSGQITLTLTSDDYSSFEANVPDSSATDPGLIQATPLSTTDEVDTAIQNINQVSQDGSVGASYTVTADNEEATLSTLNSNLDAVNDALEEVEPGSQLETDLTTLQTSLQSAIDTINGTDFSSGASATIAYALVSTGASQICETIADGLDELTGSDGTNDGTVDNLNGTNSSGTNQEVLNALQTISSNAQGMMASYYGNASAAIECILAEVDQNNAEQQKLAAQVTNASAKAAADAQQASGELQAQTTLLDATNAAGGIIGGLGQAAGGVSSSVSAGKMAKVDSQMTDMENDAQGMKMNSTAKFNMQDTGVKTKGAVNNTFRSNVSTPGSPSPSKLTVQNVLDQNTGRADGDLLELDPATNSGMKYAKADGTPTNNASEAMSIGQFKQMQTTGQQDLQTNPNYQKLQRQSQRLQMQSQGISSISMGIGQASQGIMGAATNTAKSGLLSAKAAADADATMAQAALTQDQNVQSGLSNTQTKVESAMEKVANNQATVASKIMGQS